MDNFAQASKTKVQIVMFFGTFCGPCRMLKPVLEKLPEDIYDVHFIDVEKDIRTAVREGIHSVPTVYIYNKGEKVGGWKGYIPAKRVNDLLSEVAK